MRHADTQRESKIGRSGRTARILFALLQLVLAPALGWTDALLRAEPLSSPAKEHVEDSATVSCPRVHSDECVVCRYLVTNGRTSDRNPEISWIDPVGADPLTEADSRPVAIRSGPVIPRAPPGDHARI